MKKKQHSSGSRLGSYPVPRYATDLFICLFMSPASFTLITVDWSTTNLLNSGAKSTTPTISTARHAVSNSTVALERCAAGPDLQTTTWTSFTVCAAMIKWAFRFAAPVGDLSKSALLRLLANTGTWRYVQLPDFVSKAVCLTTVLVPALCLRQVRKTILRPSALWEKRAGVLRDPLPPAFRESLLRMQSSHRRRWYVHFKIILLLLDTIYSSCILQTGNISGFGLVKMRL